MKKNISLLFVFLLYQFIINAQQQFYVSLQGNDNNPGTLAKPFRSLNVALSHTRNLKEKEIVIFVRGGKYYLDTTLQITSDLLMDHSLRITSYKTEKVIICGARKLAPEWKNYRDRILQTFPGKNLDIDQLFCNGKSLRMARYPNYDSKQRVFNGTSADAISKERVKKWKNPVGGYIHSLHQGEWGSLHYRITGVDSLGELKTEGGWQINRLSPMHPKYRFVENIFEELDAPGEWYYDRNSGILYLYPPEGINVAVSSFEYSFLDNLVVLKGQENKPVKNVTINGLRFTETNRTFMKTKEPLLRSDWGVYRGGAILLEKTENTKITNCGFDELGGNAIFVSDYNRNNIIEGNSIFNIGASAILFAGNPDAVRSPSFRYEQFVPYSKIDMKPGPKTNDYPADCEVYDNLIHDIGRTEKQVAGVGIDMSSEIRVTHNTIYNVPRAGINIGDGCWGGDIIEFNDVFNTVLETGDHGAFNSWGRDRYWLPEIRTVDSIINFFPEMPFLDVVKPIIIRNNRFHCTNGWDIDLDDGSSNYHIYNNICLNGGLKLREGFNRVVENNILINNSFHPHVWYIKSNDIFRHNIVFAEYAPIGIKAWGKEIDSNLFVLKTSLQAAQSNKTDIHSRWGNPEFVNSSTNNFTVSINSPAFKIGFKNISMNQFGVVSPVLRTQSAKAPVPDIKMLQPVKKGQSFSWAGAEIKNIEGLGERSAAGLFDENGVLIVKVENESLADKSGLKEGDVIRGINNKPVNTISEFLAAIQVVTWQGQAKASIIRNQKEQTITLFLK